jgi:uncharacterized protein
MKIIVQCDGGDLRGIITSHLLNCIEQKTGNDLNSKVHMYSGTSTGAVIVGAKTGGMTAEEINKFYRGPVIKGFKNRQRRWFNPLSWGKPIFSYKFFRGLVQGALGDQAFRQARVPTAITAFGLRKAATHFLKSWDSYDGVHPLVDVISWSALSAAHYFGKINAPNYLWDAIDVNNISHEYKGESFQDGGQGTNNCTLMYDMVEILAKTLDTEDNEIFILSMGCGSDFSIRTYKDSSTTNKAEQLFRFPFQARKESTPLQVGAAMYVASHNPHITVCRVDAKFSKKALKFGSFKYIDEYMEAAKKLEKKLPYEYFE